MTALPIPLKALEDCGAILGRRGAGKSGVGRDILEHELDAGHRCCVVDPKGDWWGIRANKDGSASRFEIPVLGGAHADIEIDDTMGAEIGEIVANSSASFVIDLSGFSVAAMRRFMTAFAEALFMHNRAPLTLLVDEADQLAPQRVSADQAKLLHHMESLIRQGRQRGIFMWMLTQRPAVINKNLLSQAETLIAMKMTGPQDRKAIRDWMDAHDPERAAEVEQDLAKLEIGQAWAWVPSADFLERVQFPLFETFDSGRTPKHGEHAVDVALHSLDLGELAALLKREDLVVEENEIDRLRAARDRAERRAAASDERALRAEVERDALIGLVIAVQDRIGATIGSPKIHAAPTGTDIDRILMIAGLDGEVRPHSRDTVRAERVAGGRLTMREAAPLPAPPPIAEIAPAEIRAAIAALADPRIAVEVSGDVPAVRRIVAAAAASGPRGATVDDLSALAGVSVTSSHLGTGLKKLVERGVIAADGDRYLLAAHRKVDA